MTWPKASSASKALIVAAALACAAAPARSATSCRIVSGNGMGFGPYDVLSAAPNDTLTTVSVTCDRDGGPASVSVNLALGTGANSTTVAARRLANTANSDSLNYGLYRDSSRSAVWGFTASDSVSLTLTFVPNKASANANFVVYGRIPAQQSNASVGTYTDAVQMTLSP